MAFSVIALILMTCFYAAYFYKQVSLRQKGIRTNRLAKGTKPKRTATIETALLLATYATAALEYASVFFSRYLLPISLPAPLRVVGLLIAALGVIFFVLAVHTMRENWRAGIDESQKTTIVTSGVYGISRNPAFVGFDLLYIGISLALPNALLWLVSIATILLLHMQILEEEKYLPHVFGDAYEHYKRKTPRYLFF